MVEHSPEILASEEKDTTMLRGAQPTNFNPTLLVFPLTPHPPPSHTHTHTHGGKDPVVVYFSRLPISLGQSDSPVVTSSPLIGNLLAMISLIQLR